MRLVGLTVLGLVLIFGAALALFRPDILRQLIFGDSGSATFAEHCLKVTGAESELGASISRSDKGFASNLGLKEHLSGSTDAKVVDRVLACVEKAFADAGIENDYITRTPLQLGLVADQWSEGEFSLHLEPMDSQEDMDVLNNLAFGPANGLRNELIDLWCKENSNCVSCQPELGAKDIASASTVSISLLPDLKVKKMYSGTAPLAGNRKHPWQLVERSDAISDEGIGERVIYECEKN